MASGRARETANHRDRPFEHRDELDLGVAASPAHNLGGLCLHAVVFVHLLLAARLVAQHPLASSRAQRAAADDRVSLSLISKLSFRKDRSSSCPYWLGRRKLFFENACRNLQIQYHLADLSKMNV